MNAWVLVVMTFTSGQTNDPVFDPVAYFKTPMACQAAAVRATARPAPPGIGREYRCVFNGV